MTKFLRAENPRKGTPRSNPFKAWAASFPPVFRFASMPGAELPGPAFRSSFQENRANCRPISLKMLLLALQRVDFRRAVNAVDLAITPDEKGTPDTVMSVFEQPSIDFSAKSIRLNVAFATARIFLDFALNF